MDMGEAKTLTQFERDVLDRILRGDDPVIEALRRQLAAASVSGRQFTGVGFYTDFVVPDDVPRVHNVDESLGTESDFEVGDVGAIFEDANVEVGFILFVRRGRITFLEGYTYGDDTWPEREGKYRLFYFGELGTQSGGGEAKGDEGLPSN